MIAEHEIALAVAADATRIATMSRDLIEHGLAWRWTPPRILRMIRDPATNVAVARGPAGVTGFALMRYKDDEAHLLLLGVDPGQRRTGVGRALMRWLEASALTAGIGFVYLEARARNTEARAFYRELGYVEIRTVRGLYSNDEDGVRIARDLWAGM
ncbi:MAG TPA: GNAT family N-acetyltransferase [Rhodanobacteraceae bacterium]|nr:GNAT family N-acetyltransferase [Rhodanobacteraceae bacterium]